MRTGRVTQTIWNRSVKKQIQKGNRNSIGKAAWEESSSELVSDDKDFVWSSASVSCGKESQTNSGFSTDFVS